MSHRLTVIVVCFPLFLAVANAFAQGPPGPPGPPIPPVHTKTWQNLTHPGGPAQVGDTIEFTIFYNHQCTDLCFGAVSLTDALDPGLLFLAFTQGGGSCTQVGGVIDCEFSYNCQDVPGPFQIKFTARVLATGQICNHHGVVIRLSNEP